MVAKSSSKSKAAKKEQVAVAEPVKPVAVEDTHMTSSDDDVVADPQVHEEKKEQETISGEKSSGPIESVFCSKMSNFISKVGLINKEVKELQSLGKTLEKEFSNVMKAMSKQKNKSKHSESRSLSGFAMPSMLTPELYNFLIQENLQINDNTPIKQGELVPRKDVTKMLNTYIIQNNLRNENDRRKIIPNDSLKQIFNCTDNDEVTYFNLQKYLKHHFIKPPTKATSTAVEA